jgi:sugar phosphate isomerase/epimerase
MFSRRQFLASTIASVAAGSAIAIDPKTRPAGPANVQLGIAAYSYRKYLELKKPTMTLFDFIELAAKLKVETVELTQYYWAEKSDSYTDKLKDACAKNNLKIACLPTRNDFCQKDDAKRKADIESVKEWTKRATRLGTKAVRIFAGNVPKGDELKATQERCAKAIQECCQVAEDVGVTLCLENHGGVTETAEKMLPIVKMVESKAFGVNIDSSNFRVSDPFAELAKIVPFGVVCQIKTELYKPEKKKDPMDFEKFFKVLKDANYSGPVCLEHEADEDPKEFVPVYMKKIQDAKAKVYS